MARTSRCYPPTIGRQLLELGLIDEIDIHVAPVLLGDGVRLYAGERAALETIDVARSGPLTDIRFRVQR